MKGKLHKMESGYILSLNGDIDDPYAIVNKELAEDYGWYRISIKNCQVIERGWDLDELAKREYLDGYDTTELCRTTFKDGFQKALEILGDKKFSEEDVRKAIESARNGSMQEQHNGYGRPTELRFVLDNLSVNDIIQSLQQTEWEVEILEECLDKNCDGINKKGECITTGKPKLDKEGCLILKKL